MARTLNLGILAHVDAGKTSLTERLLFTAGVIDAVGSVDDGSTQTDTLELERRRGITIKSAVVSFAIADVTVDLIDTPGHPDFIAEVERVLDVLDGVVLVLSAVEGVQAQTRVLMRTLQRLHLPTLLFVNKIDRAGADPDRVLADIAARLSPAIVPMARVADTGTRAARCVPRDESDPSFVDQLADVLTVDDDALLAAYLDEAGIGADRWRRALVGATRRAAVHPVFFGSAITGAGVAELMDGIAELLPAVGGDADGPPVGTVFKIERGPAGERIAYVRMSRGTVRVRDRVAVGDAGERTITAIHVFEHGAAVPRPSVGAGRIATVAGLGAVRIGDRIGAGPVDGDDPRPASPAHHFTPPTLETVIVPRRHSDAGRLRVALAQLAEQDPLIDVRQDDVRHELSVSLYGEVQKEVVEATLATDFGIGVEFRPSTTICVERVVGTGAAVEDIDVAPNPFLATVGLRVEPAAPGAGVDYHLAVELGSLPLSFHAAVEESVRRTLRHGLHGWDVTGCRVTMTDAGYWSTTSTAGDFRDLTPLVLMDALRRAGTVVHEPVHRFRLELPSDLVGPALPVLAGVGGLPDPPTIGTGWSVVEGTIPVARIDALRRRLPAMTRGEGVLETEFDAYRPVVGPVPTRPRTDRDPLHRAAYLSRVAGRF